MAGDRRFVQVDVFTGRALRGNPVAVVLDGDGLPAAEMQQCAAWTNLSETVFVLPPTAPGADYRVRIFTPRAEIPFAGHPTVGTAHAVLEAGVVAGDRRALAQECGAGVVPLRIETDGGGRRIFVRVPPARVRDEPRAAADRVGPLVAHAVSGRPRVVDVGAVWLVAQLGDEAAVRAATPDSPGIAALSAEIDAGGLTVFALTGGDPAVVVRSFAPAHGIVEDPVCGSGNASVAAYLVATGLLAETGGAYVASQGREVGREGIVQVRVGEAGRAIEIGGDAVTVVEGRLRL
jgi:PhzF family phenazine biosynthesis protein